MANGSTMKLKEKVVGEGAIALELTTILVAN